MIEDLEDSYAEILKRRREFVEYGKPDAISEVARAKANIMVIQQAQLHRVERLIFSSGTMLLERNVYGLVLMVRALFESTAFVGFLCSRLKSYSDKTIDFERVAFDIAYAFLGTKHEIYKDAPAPINVLTCIEKTDRYLLREKGIDEKYLVADCYRWLSEFAHPNFNSHDASLRLNKALNRFEICHDETLPERHIKLFEYLGIGAGIFVLLYDDLEQLATSTGF